MVRMVRGASLPLRRMRERERVYLDNNATTRPCEAATMAADRALRDLWHNPSSVHQPGQAARHAIEIARAQTARLLGVAAREITFTSGGTEALDCAIRGVLDAALSAEPALPPLLVTSALEHAAIRDLAAHVETIGAARVVRLPVTREGAIDATRFEELITRGAALVAVAWANNETGVVQPVEEIRTACVRAGVPLLLDATQWVGKHACEDVSGLCDLLVCSAHKFHGIKGCGVLWASPRVAMRPQLLGTQERGRRGGTENVPAILACGAACAEALAFVQDGTAIAHGRAMRDALERGLRERVPEIVIHGEGVERLWNTSSVAFPRLQSEALLMALSERGVCASAGAACSSGSLEPSPVLLAMGMPEHLAHGTVRFSLSRETTREEVGRAIETITHAVLRVARSMPGG